MHTFVHEETGVRIHHDGNGTGKTIISVPLETPDGDGINVVTLQRRIQSFGDGKPYFEICGIPAAALAALSETTTIEKVMSTLEAKFL